MPKTFETDITIHGGIDPSLVKATGFSIQQLQRIQKAAQVMNREYSRAAQELNKLTPPMAKFNAQVKISESLVQKLGTSLRRIGQFAAGDLLSRGITGAVGMVERLGHGFLEFSKESSNIAAKRELMSKGIGNILGDQGLADQIMKREQAQAILSPFQASDLQSTVKRFVAAGAGADQAQWLTKHVGDIVAGIGGGAPEMERAALAFGKILSGGSMTGMEARELKDLGIPFQKTLQETTGLDAEGLRKAQEKGKITTDVVTEMVKRLTGAGGMFHDGMLHFAETMVGLETSLSDMWHRFQADFGDTINEFGAMFAKFLINNDVWNRMSVWLNHMHEMAHAVTSLISTLPTADLMAKFQPILDKFKAPFDQMNAWINSFFTLVKDPVNGRHRVLNATGDQAVKDAIANMADITKRFADFVTSDSVKTVAGMAKAQMQQLVDDIRFLIDAIADLDKGDYGKLLKDFQDFNAGYPKAGDEGNGSPSGFDDFQFNKSYQMYGPHVRSGTTLSDNPGSVYEQYGWEGHTANYGPKGNRLGEGYGIGIGEDLQASTGARYGKWVKVRFADGTTMWRQVNETSERKHGIEFFTNKRGEYNRHGKANIEEVRDNPPQASANPVTINMHIQTLDSHGFDRVLKENSDSLGRHIARALQNQFSAQAVV